MLKNTVIKVRGQGAIEVISLAAGMYVITQTGDTVKISVPDGFVPQPW